MWDFRSMVTHSAEPLQTVKGINNNLLEFGKSFYLNKLGFYQFSGEKKDYQYLKLNFPNIVWTQVTAPLFQIDFQLFVFRSS